MNHLRLLRTLQPSAAFPMTYENKTNLRTLPHNLSILRLLRTLKFTTPKFLCVLRGAV